VEEDKVEEEQVLEAQSKGGSEGELSMRDNLTLRFFG
jgi:hypothetical protein